jgi:hypothetical protein
MAKRKATAKEPVVTQAVVEPEGPYVPYGEHGEIADTTGARTFHLIIEGKRWEHVSDTPDGRWVYRQS